MITTLTAAWGIFTAALAAWWFIFSLRQLALIQSIDHQYSETLMRNQRMLVWEGVTLLALILIGGVALLYVSYRARREARKVKDFFGTFTHELKTPLASLKLQVETLMEEQDSTEQAVLLERVLADTERLNLRIENSLMLPSLDDYIVFRQELDLRELLDQVQHSWPGIFLQHSGQGSAIVFGDKRAILSILNNIVHNSLVHGKADSVSISVLTTPQSPNHIQISLTDNGIGLTSGSEYEISTPFNRRYAGSGTGIGLYLAKLLCKRMNGEFTIQPETTGFTVILTLEGKYVAFDSTT